MRLIGTIFFVVAACILPAVSSAQDRVPSEEEIIKLFRVDAGNVSLPKSDMGLASSLLGCVGDSWIDLTQREMSSGKEREAGALASKGAKDRAYCALVELGRASDRTHAAASFARQVGILLGHSVSLNRQSDSGGGSQDNVAQRVVAYLTFAKANGDSASAIYLEQFQRNSLPPSKRVNEPAEYTLPASDAVTMISGNEMAFKKKYGGRILEIIGEVSRLFHYNDEVTLYLRGAPKGDEVQCKISDVNEKLKLDNAMPGMKLSARGVYYGVIQGYTNKIILAACRIVTSSTPSFGAPKLPE